MRRNEDFSAADQPSGDQGVPINVQITYADECEFQNY